MNADQARQVLLLRACEDATQAAPATTDPAATTLWTADDSAWANAEAMRVLGERSTAEQFLVQRSIVAGERLGQRDPSLALLLRPSTASSGWLLAAFVMLAFFLGLASDVVASAGQINILAPPLLVVMLWNIAVYLGLLGSAARTVFSRTEDRSANGRLAPAGGWRQRWASSIATRLAGRRPRGRTSAAVRRFFSDWSAASAPLQLARLATLLHLSALAVAAGALLAIYTRGLVFEFKAGWDSTFLNAETVHRWLQTLLAPALAMTGQDLPDPAQLEALRFSHGGGENAARWIHWYAITTGLVMAPRLVLALFAMARSHKLRADFPLPMGERYFQRLLQGFAHLSRQTAQVVAVLPYSYQAADQHRSALAAAIDEAFGPGLQLSLLPNVAMAGEDDLPDDWPQSAFDNEAAHLLLPLFALSATPERETHGAFIRAVLLRSTRLPGHPQCRVMIDESGFRQRQAGVDLERRLADRRLAWQKLLDQESAGPALFVDLGAAKRTNS